MSPRRKQAHPQSILGWLFADPWRKLGAIALALVSWEYLDTKVNASLKSTLQIRLPSESGTSGDNYLRIVIDAQDYTLVAADVMDDNNQPLSEVKIEMKGVKARINRLRGQLALMYRPTPAQLERAKDKGLLDFDVDDLLHRKTDLGGDLGSLDSVEMKPATIRLRIRPNLSKNQLLVAEHVRLEYGDSGLEDRLGSPEFSVQMVELRGPRLAIEAINPTGEIFRGQVPGRNNKDATTVRIELELLPSFKDVVTRPNTVFVTYPVEPDWQLVELKNVLVEVDHRLLQTDKRGLFKAVPRLLPIVRLRVKGDLAIRLQRLSVSQKQEFVRDHLRLVVYPQPSDLDEPLAKRPQIEFVRLDDIPTPRLGVDFQVVDVEQVRIALTNKPLAPAKNNGK